jgi:hypothetical protein
MVSIRIMVFFLCCLLSTPALAGDSYICIADMATGFSFDKSRRQWSSANFKATGKYIVSKATIGENAWDVKEVGAPIPMSFCKNDFNEFGLLTCDGLFQFRMSKNNLRFIRTALIGYWNDDLKGSKGEFLKEGANEPSIEIGKCSPL